jgi:hypothetical protein
MTAKIEKAFIIGCETVGWHGQYRLKLGEVSEGLFPRVALRDLIIEDPTSQRCVLDAMRSEAGQIRVLLISIQGKDRIIIGVEYWKFSGTDVAKWDRFRPRGDYERLVDHNNPVWCQASWDNQAQKMAWDRLRCYPFGTWDQPDGKADTRKMAPPSFF